MMDGRRTVTLSHYQELVPGDLGSRLEPRDRYRFTPESRLASELRSALQEGVSEVALDGSLVNPEPVHAESLARLFSELPEEITIPFARWQPTGPRSPSMIPLLRRIRELEIPYQSTGRRARALYRTRHPHRCHAATLKWLGKHGIKPTLSIEVGLPGDDELTLLETLRRVYSLRPSRVQLHQACAPPGGHLDRHRARYRLTSEPDPPFRVKSHLTADRLELAWTIRICRTSIAGYNRWLKLSRVRRT
jgi:hypothetical protein